MQPLNPDDWLYMGSYLVGPHPITKEARRWFYTNTLPPVPLSPEDNEKAEKIACDIFNAPEVKG